MAARFTDAVSDPRTPHVSDHLRVPIRNRRLRRGEKPLYWLISLIDQDGFVYREYRHETRKAAFEFRDELMRLHDDRGRPFLKGQVRAVFPDE